MTNLPRLAAAMGLCATCVTGASTALQAQDDSWLLFSDTSISLLHGTGFELPGNNVSTVTFEHVSGWKWGDVFMFFDYLDYHDNPVQGSSWYGEFSPRFSFGKLAGLEFGENSFIRDVLISTTYERGKNGVEALLIGGAVDLNIPGFNFFNVNAYARKDTGLGAGFDDMQWTLAFAYPIETANNRFMVDGFIDYVVGWGPQETAFHSVTQVKWDIGHKFDLDKPLYFGAEIDIWDNQFGVKDTPALDTNQIAISAILKAHF